MKIFLKFRCTTKFLICVFAILVYILLASFLHLLLFLASGLLSKVLSQLNKKLAGFIKLILGIKINIEGKEFIPRKGNFFIFSNHLTYLDGIIICSLFPVIFVSKREVKFWPLFGQMASLGATIFIDRKRKERSPDYIERISQAIKNKVNVLIFPEGTSTGGTKLLPFQTIFFSPPVITRRPLLPIVVKYIKIENENLSEKNKDKVYWYGKAAFFNHLWNFLNLKGITVIVKLNPVIDSANFTADSLGRKALSDVCYKTILRMFQNN